MKSVRCRLIHPHTHGSCCFVTTPTRIARTWPRIANSGSFSAVIMDPLSNNPEEEEVVAVDKKQDMVEEEVEEDIFKTAAAVDKEKGEVNVKAGVSMD